MTRVIHAGMACRRAGGSATAENHCRDHAVAVDRRRSGSARGQAGLLQEDEDAGGDQPRGGDWGADFRVSSYRGSASTAYRSLWMESCASCTSRRRPAGQPPSRLPKVVHDVGCRVTQRNFQNLQEAAADWGATLCRRRPLAST